MIDRYVQIELAKLYKRIFEIEISLKQKMFFALKETYHEKMFFRIIPYINSLKNVSKEILKIQKTELSEEKKLNKFLSMAYMSDVLNILTMYKPVYKYKIFQKNFYGYEIDDARFQEVITFTGKLIKLRNSIMHFNVSTYRKSKSAFLETLIYWEKLLDCPNMKYIHGHHFTDKPRVASILKALAETYPDFLNLSDRLVCDMFDDIAFINGWDINNLPEYWTIGRTLYDLKRKYKSRISE